MAKKHIADKAVAIEKLERRLYSAQELFELFAEPFDLPEIKLALCHCADIYDPRIVDGLCVQILDQGRHFFCFSLWIFSVMWLSPERVIY